MPDYEEKAELLKLFDTVTDTRRLARGLDQLLESLARADQLAPFNVERALALRATSERCACIGNAAHTPKAQNEILYAEERTISPKHREGLVAESAVRTTIAVPTKTARVEHPAD